MCIVYADQNGRAVKGVGLRLLAFWNSGFDSLRGHDVCCECCVLLVTSLCEGPIPRPEVSC